MSEVQPPWQIPPASVRILIVDDDTNVQLLLRSMLAHLDHINVAVARDLADARHEIRVHAVQLVFLDIHLAADTSGLELLKELSERAHPPFVVMLTADSTMENFKRAMELGAGYFVAKPFNGVKVRAALIKFHQTRGAPH